LNFKVIVDFIDIQVKQTNLNSQNPQCSPTNLINSKNAWTCDAPDIGHNRDSAGARGNFESSTVLLPCKTPTFITSSASGQTLSAVVLNPVEVQTPAVGTSMWEIVNI
jgi:hypothetical protein